jgi:hypothetical protein
MKIGKLRRADWLEAFTMLVLAWMPSLPVTPKTGRLTAKAIAWIYGGVQEPLDTPLEEVATRFIQTRAQVDPVLVVSVIKMLDKGHELGDLPREYQDAYHSFRSHLAEVAIDETSIAETVVPVAETVVPVAETVVPVAETVVPFTSTIKWFGGDITTYGSTVKFYRTFLDGTTKVLTFKQGGVDVDQLSDQEVDMYLSTGFEPVINSGTKTKAPKAQKRSVPKGFGV